MKEMLGPQIHDLAENVFVCSPDQVFICKAEELKEYAEECKSSSVNETKLYSKWSAIQAFFPGYNFEPLSSAVTRKFDQKLADLEKFDCSAQLLSSSSSEKYPDYDSEVDSDVCYDDDDDYEDYSSQNDDCDDEASSCGCCEVEVFNVLSQKGKMANGQKNGKNGNMSMNDLMEGMVQQMENNGLFKLFENESKKKKKVEKKPPHASKQQLTLCTTANRKILMPKQKDQTPKKAEQMNRPGVELALKKVSSPSAAKVKEKKKVPETKKNAAAANAEKKKVPEAKKNVAVAKNPEANKETKSEEKKKDPNIEKIAKQVALTEAALANINKEKNLKTLQEQLAKSLKLNKQLMAAKESKEVEGLAKTINPLTKAERKMLKKQRQKEKKDSSSSSSITIGSRKPSPDRKKDSGEKLSVGKDKEETRSQCEDERCEESDVDEDIQFADEDAPAFVKSLLHKNTKEKKEEPKVSKKNPKVEQKMESTSSKAAKKKPEMPLMKLKTGQECLKKAIELSLTKNTSSAIACFSRAIQLEPNNLGHFLNRSFCHLTLKDSTSAINDARHVLDKSNNTNQICAAHFYMGLAYYSVQNFEMAEECYKEASKIDPENPSVRRELAYLKVKQLVSMGFTEKKVLQVLRDHEALEDACSVLTDQSLGESKDEESCDSGTEDLIFESDDEGDPSLSRMLTNLVNYYEKNRQAKAIEQQRVLTPINYVPNNTGTVKKQIAAPLVNKIPKIQKINDKEVNDRCLWIGNLTPQVTELMIRKKFTRIGKVQSIYLISGTTFGFINFESPILVASAIEAMKNCEINGVRVSIRPKPIKHL